MTYLEITMEEMICYLKITGIFQKADQQVKRRKVTVAAAGKMLDHIDEKLLSKKCRDIFRMFISAKVSKQSFESFLKTNILIKEVKDELLKNSDKSIYYSSPEIRESIREMIYQEWLDKTIEMITVASNR